MKPVENSPIINKKVTRIQEEDPDKYWCRHCGESNCGVVRFAETGYGTASLLNLDAELDNQETDDYDNFEITNYMCTNCNYESISLRDVFTGEDPNDFDEDEEEEDECLCVSHN